MFQTLTDTEQRGRKWHWRTCPFMSKGAGTLHRDLGKPCQSELHYCFSLICMLAYIHWPCIGHKASAILGSFLWTAQTCWPPWDVTFKYIICKYTEYLIWGAKTRTPWLHIRCGLINPFKHVNQELAVAFLQHKDEQKAQVGKEFPLSGVKIALKHLWLMVLPELYNPSFNFCSC